MGQEENRFNSLSYVKRTPLQKIDGGFFEDEGFRIGNWKKKLSYKRVHAELTQNMTFLQTYNT